ncbi:MAG: hypothetical protein M1826_005632 [Phylliscum demangeonii]|nr:MAG: hypothetical protein M1826_005632 [Phylliscum demangeonii]
MPIPFEALLPYGVIISVRSHPRALPLPVSHADGHQMFMISGGLMGRVKIAQNSGKLPRYCLDQWERQSKLLGPVMDRDARLTGHRRGQTDNVLAPPGFELNNPWKVSVAGGNGLSL